MFATAKLAGPRHLSAGIRSGVLMCQEGAKTWTVGRSRRLAATGAADGLRRMRIDWVAQVAAGSQRAED